MNLQSELLQKIMICLYYHNTDKQIGFKSQLPLFSYLQNSVKWLLLPIWYDKVGIKIITYSCKLDPTSS